MTFVGELASVPPWMLYAVTEIGQVEGAGEVDNPRVVWYHGATAAGEAPDDVPWCSSFVNRMLKCAGVVGTRSKAAKSWLGWGEPLAWPQVGAITVIAHPGHHVGFWLGANQKHVYLLGGNQSNSVNVTAYLRTTVQGYRWPRAHAPA